MRILAVLLLLLMTACQMTPTKVGESSRREFSLLVDKTKKPLVITEGTVVLDARSSFDYGLNRVENSLHLSWESLAENSQTGEVLRDKRKLATRLSLLGLQPTTSVVAVGYGLNGKGEEGRLAWTLLYLGFQDVQVAAIELLRNNLTQKPTPPPQNVPVWPVNPREGLQIGLKEFEELAANPKLRREKKIFFVDVRSQSEYFNKTPTKRGPAPDLNALNIEWKEFYTAMGRPNPAIAAKLLQLGIAPTDRVIIFSEKGVRSGAAAYALLALGFTRVQNFTGGWNQFLKN